MMYDQSYTRVSGTSGNNMKRHSYVHPNTLSPVTKYNNGVPTFTDINPMVINGSFEHIGNNSTNKNTINNTNISHVDTNKHMRNTPAYLNTALYPSDIVYTKNYSNKGKGVVSAMKNTRSSINNCPTSSNCLTNFPCLKKTNKNIDRCMTPQSRTINNQRYIMKNTSSCSDNDMIMSHKKTSAPTPTPAPLPMHIRTSNENIYVPTNRIPNYESTSNKYNHHQYVIRPASIEQFPTTIQPTENNIMYTCDGYNNANTSIVQDMKREELNEEITKKNYLNLNLNLSKQNFNNLIHEKEKKIQKLENSIIKENTLNAVNDTVENNKLKEKILDQKTKYEEALKYVKKLEVEKRNLKKSLNVRDKVLNKLENEMESVDNENDFLIKAKEKTSLQDIHNVFKYLHGDGKDLIKKNTNGKGNSKYEEDLSESEDEENEEEIKEITLKKKTTPRNLKKKNALDKDDVYSLKEAIVKLEKENQELKNENKNVNFKYENTFKTLSELRKDALEYMESIVSRDTRIAYMETTLQKCEKDLSKLREHSTKQKILYEGKIDQCSSEIKVLEKQTLNLQEMIQEKDSQIVLLKSEIVRNETLIKQFEERNKELQSELRLMCNNLESVIEASNQKDLYMNELEKQLRENEVNRQHAYLKELAKNRKVHADMKFKEILYDSSVKSKIDEVHHLKQELYVNNLHVQKAKNAFEILQKAPKLGYLLPETSFNTESDNNNKNVLEDCKNDQTINTEESACSDVNDKKVYNTGNNEKRVKSLTTKAKKYTETAANLKKKSLEKGSKI